MPEDPPPDDWDETVDVLCVGGGPGALAYGLFCAAADLDVLILESDELDPQTRHWYVAMTEDLDGCPADPRLALIRAEPLPAQKINDRTRLEPFVGEQLRRWSAQCLSSPFGVVTSEVPDFTPMRTEDGESVLAGVSGQFQCAGGPIGPALVQWFREQAEPLFAPASDRLDGLIVVDGRIAGAILDTVDGPCRIGATRGLALSIGAAPDSWPDQPELAGSTVDVAVLSRRAGRFGTVGLLAR